MKTAISTNGRARTARRIKGMASRPARPAPRWAARCALAVTGWPAYLLGTRAGARRADAVPRSGVRVFCTRVLRGGSPWVVFSPGAKAGPADGSGLLDSGLWDLMPGDRDRGGEQWTC